MEILRARRGQSSRAGGGYGRARGGVKRMPNRALSLTSRGGSLMSSGIPDRRYGGCVSQLSEKIADLPALPGVYLFKDARGEVLYVGKALSLAARVRSYLAPDPQRPLMS